jgi:putative acetyltransferase
MVGENEANVTLVPFTIDMYDTVYALWGECEGVGVDSDCDSRCGVQAYLDRNPGMSFVAMAGATIVGAVLAGHDGRRGFMYHLAVRPSHRRHGIGRVLVERCLAALGEAGIHKCHVFVFHANAGGKAFWQSVGWTLRTDIRALSTMVEPPPGNPI